MFVRIACLLVALAVAGDLEQLARQGSWDELIQAASERLDADAGDTTARYWLGRAQLERGLELLAGQGSLSTDLARALLERAEQSLAAVDPVPGSVTEDVCDWWWLARFEHVLSAERPDLDALAVDLEQEWAQTGRAKSAWLLGVLARGTPDAVTWFGRAVEAEPARADLALDWADALSAAGRRDEALAAWRQARGAGGALDGLLAVLVAILPAKGDAEARLAELDALRDHPAALGHARLAWHRAYALGQLARWEQAALAFSEGPRGEDVDYDRAHASMLRRLGRQAEAAALLTPWIARRNWDAYDDLVGLADEFAMARRWDESLDLYQRALDLEDRDERALRNRALTLARAGRGGPAQQAWDGLVELFPDRSDILNDAGLVAWGAGDKQRARQLLTRAAELPGSEDARENLAAWLLRFEPDEGARARELLGTVLAVEPERDRALYLRLLGRARP